MEIVFTTLKQPSPSNLNTKSKTLYYQHNISHWKYNFKVYLIHEKEMMHSKFKKKKSPVAVFIAFEKESLIIQEQEKTQDETHSARKLFLQISGFKYNSIISVVFT